MGRSPSHNPLVKNQVGWLETTCSFHVLLCYIGYSFITYEDVWQECGCSLCSVSEWVVHCGIRGSKRCLKGTVLWTELCGSFQMVVVRKCQGRPFFASKNMVISAPSNYKTAKRSGWENLCGQTEAAFVKAKREGSNFGFQILPVLSCFVLAVLITSSSVQ